MPAFIYGYFRGYIMWKADDFYIRNLFIGKAVMSLEETQQTLDNQRVFAVYEISEVLRGAERPGVCFFTNDYLFGNRNKEGYQQLPNGFVPSAISLPHKVSGRPGLENGEVKTLKDYDLVYRGCHRNESRQTRINTLDELVAYLNTYYPEG